MKGNLLYSMCTDLNLITSNIQSHTMFRLVFDQTMGYHGLAKLTLEINCHKKCTFPLSKSVTKPKGKGAGAFRVHLCRNITSTLLWERVSGFEEDLGRGNT